MGEIIKVHCRTCRKEWECMTGCGLRHGRIANAIAAFDTEEQVRILDWRQASPVPLYDFKYQIAACDFCNNLVIVPVLSAIDGDEIFVGTCTICHRPLQTPPLETEDVPDTACPSCGNMTLAVEEVGHWD